MTDTVPSINKCAEHNKITEYFMCQCGDQSVLLTAFTQDFLFLTSLGKIKKKLIPFSLAALFCKQRNAYYPYVLKNVAVRERLCACTDNNSAVTVKRSILIYSTTIYIYIYTVKPTLKDTCI